MSMPTFPKEATEITCEQAFNMLLGSIAMEEIGLSHIINAEGEKLQYILGTLPNARGICATKQDVLAVNRSVTQLLQSVMQNQILLKNKLECVLEAKERLCPSPPNPGCCNCCKPCECAGCCNCGAETACCCQTASPASPEAARAACLYRAPDGFSWKYGTHLPWRCVYGEESGLCWQGCAPSALYFDPSRAFLLSVSLLLYAPRGSELTVSLQSSQRGARELLELHGCAHDASTPIHLSGVTVLPPAGMGASPAALLLALESPKHVTVERAILSLAAL